MKKIKWAAAVLLLAIIPVLTWVSTGHAQRFSPTITEDQVVHGSLYAANKSIDIKGEVYGDIFCAGQSVKIDAKVHGDVICAGVEVTVKGQVDGDIRLAGQIVNVGAKIAGSATVGAGEFSLDADASVGRDLTATGSNANIKGTVGRDVLGGGSRITINGAVGRNVAVETGALVLKDDAKIAGTVTYTSSNQLNKSDKAEVSGKITQNQPVKQGYSFDPLWFLFMLIGLTLVSMTLALLFPRFMAQSANQMRQQFGKTLIVGLLAMVLVPGVFFGLAVTVVGIPLMVVAAVAVLFGLLLSGPLAAYFVGRLILKNNQAPVLAAVVGSAVLVALYFLPFVGFVFVLLAGFLGFGALLLELQKLVKAAPASPAKEKK